ncbi:putative head completion protein [Pectobacterium bacteriophage PM2]|uniref:Putative head completion protein n=1 Tax=Pectobacterium bacteriophage PM2 TaxID=1429794 RepID=A0A0A0Q0I2_9CAUD|nr:putative head completion protein [Pectobacterium bacteriophage PM2]AHY25131.1 putative head completion protein [Pectobacterium bacteriophage PM2]
MAYSGKFIPVNKEKYKGDWRKITYRSSWEAFFHEVA